MKRAGIRIILIAALAALALLLVSCTFSVKVTDSSGNTHEITGKDEEEKPQGTNPENPIPIPGHTIKFMVNGEEYHKDKNYYNTIYLGTKVERPADYTDETGTYRFVRWDDGKGHVPVYYSGKVLQSDLTFTAIFRKLLDEYIVTFEDPLGNTTQVTCPRDTRLVLPQNPPSHNEDDDYEYVFLGWFGLDGKQLSGQYSTPGQTTGVTVDDHLIYVAQYQKYRRYAYTFMDGDKVVSEGHVRAGNKIQAPETPARFGGGRGLNFVGWFDEAGVKFDFAKPVAASTTLRAVFICPGDKHAFACDPVQIGETTYYPCAFCDYSKTFGNRVVATPGIEKKIPNVKRTVTFLDHEGQILETMKVQNGEKIGTLPTAPAREGLVLYDWYAGEQSVKASTYVFSNMTLRPVYTCKNGHHFADAFEFVGDKIVYPCADCDYGIVYQNAFLYTMEDGKLPPLQASKTATDTTYGAVISRVTEGSEHYARYRYQDAGQSKTVAAQILPTQINSFATYQHTSGIFTMKLRVNPAAANDEQTLKVQLSSGLSSSFQNNPDGEGNSANNSYAFCGLLFVRGTNLYRGDETTSFVTLSSDEFAEIIVKYDLDTTADTLDVDYYVDGVHVGSWHRTGVVMNYASALDFRMTLHGNDQTFDLDDVGDYYFFGRVPVIR